MNILVLNCGSSSVKCQLVETSPELYASNRDRQLAKVIVEKIGAPESPVSGEAFDKPPLRFERHVPGHHEAVELAVDTLMAQLGGLLHSKEEIGGVGHRIVHGGERFTHSVLMDDRVVREIEELSELAPLHNPANLKGFFAARDILPHAPHVAVFDTSFHQTIPRQAYTYGLPYGLSGQYRIRRYGFHGTSHRYVVQRFAQLQGSAPEDFKIITCHLGNGCSMTAVNGGRSVDTSMGFTPLEGLLMGTRSGDIDPAAVLYLMEREALTPEQTGRILNHQGGLLGLSGVASDMRTLVEHSRQGHERARLAIDVFCYRVKKYIGAYFAVLNGCDALIFTGGIGENRPEIRAGVCDSLGALGVRLDPERNASVSGTEGRISGPDSPMQVWVIPTNEELVIARDTLNCILSGHHGAFTSE